MIFVRCPFLKYLKCIDSDIEIISVDELRSVVSAEIGVTKELLEAYNGCYRLSSDLVVPNGSTVYFTLSLPGGKGGFGSMLRAIGAQIEKTTNREACRDLSGRRLRDINEEQRLKKWLAKKVEREAQAKRRHKERLERLKQQPKHDFNDPEYNKQRSELPERIDDALSIGLKKSKPVLGKKQAEEIAGPAAKKPCLWPEVEVSSDSDTSDEDRLVINDDGSSSNESTTSFVEDSRQVDDNGNSEETTESVIPPDEQCDSSSISNTDVHQPDKEQISKSEQNNNCCTTDERPKDESTDVVHYEISKEDLMKYNSIAELEELGLENLKIFLLSQELKCGGTLAERAQRVWSIRSLDPKDYPQSLKAKVKKSAKA